MAVSRGHVSSKQVFSNQADAYGWIPGLDDTLRYKRSLPVGPDFGAGYQNTNRQYGRNRNTAAQTNYDDLVWFWAKGLFVSDSAGENPAYDPQGTYGMPPWAQSQQSMCICIFDRKFAHIYFPSKVYTFTAEPAVHATEPAVCCFARVVYRERRLEREIAFSNVLDRDLTAERLLFRGVRERTQQAGFAPLTPPRRTAGPVSINVARKLIFRKFSISLAWLATLRLLSFQSGVNPDTFAILNRHYESG